jgi:hypothetical protein
MDLKKGFKRTTYRMHPIPIPIGIIVSPIKDYNYLIEIINILFKFAYIMAMLLRWFREHLQTGSECLYGAYG